MNPEINAYIDAQPAEYKLICNQLARVIDKNLTFTEDRIWHAHPVWFINENPIVGFSNQKAGIRLMFWSGASFDEEALNVKGKKFKDASIYYTDASQISEEELKRWLTKAEIIQWDYKNIVKRKGRLEKLPASPDFTS